MKTSEPGGAKLARSELDESLLPPQAGERDCGRGREDWEDEPGLDHWAAA